MAIVNFVDLKVDTNDQTVTLVNTYDDEENTVKVVTIELNNDQVLWLFKKLKLAYKILKES